MEGSRINVLIFNYLDGTISSSFQIMIIKSQNHRNGVQISLNEIMVGQLYLLYKTTSLDLKSIKKNLFHYQKHPNTLQFITFHSVT